MKQTFVFVISFLWTSAPQLLEQCLSFESKSGLCFGCKNGYFQEDPGTPFSFQRCVPKSASCPFRKILVSQQTDCKSCGEFFDEVYKSLGEALVNMSQTSAGCKFSSFEVFLHGTRHSLSHFNGKNKSVHLFRRNNASIFIKPLSCEEYNIPNCLQNGEKAELILRTDEFLIFVAGDFKLKNIILNAVDLQFSKRATGQSCLSSVEYCCESPERVLNEIWNASNSCGLKYYAVSAEEEILFGLFNMEPIFDEQNLSSYPQMKLEHCDFKNFFLTPTTKFQTILLIHTPLPYSLAIVNSSFTFSFLKRGIIYSRSMAELVSVDPLYIFSEYNFSSTTKTDVKDFQANTYFSLADSKVENLFSPENFKTGEFGVRSDIFFVFEPRFSSLFFKNFTAQKISGSDTFLLTLIGGSQNMLKKIEMSDVKALSNSNLSYLRLENINDIYLNVKNFSAEDFLFASGNGVLIKIQNCSLELQSFSFDRIFSLPKNLLSFVIINSKLYLNNFSFKTSGNLQFSISKSALKADSWILKNITFLTLLFSIIEGNFTLFNSSISNTLGSSFSKTVLCFASSSDVVFMQSALKAVFSSIIFDFRLVRTNLLIRTTIENMNGVSYFYSLDSSFKIISIDNSTIADSSFEHLGYWLVPSLFEGYKPLFSIKFSEIRNFLCLNAFFSAFSKIDFTIESSILFNFTSRSDGQLVRFWFIARESVLSILNSFFERNGFEYEPTKVNYPANYPLFLTTQTSRMQIRSCSFRNDEKVSLLSGFLIAYYLTGTAEISDSTFEAVNRNPKFTYHGLLFSVVQSIILKNNTIKNLGCPAWKFFSQYHFNAVVTLIGDESDRFLFNKKEAFLEGNFFQDCKCVRGSGIFSSNYHNITLKNNRFVSNQAIQGGSLGIILSSNVYLYSNTIINSKAVSGGAGIVMDVINFTVRSLVVTNSSSTSGGSFTYANVNFISISLCVIDNSTSSSEGGFSSISNSKVTISNSTFSSIFSGADGGILVLLSLSSMIFENNSVFDSSARYGGVLSALLAKEILINNSIFFFVFSSQDGAAFYFESLLTVNISNSVISKSNAAGSGTIFIKTAEEEAVFYLFNISCLNSSAKQGSCIYFYSPVSIFVQDLLLVQCREYALKFFSTTSTSIILERLSAENNVVSDPVLFFQGVDLQLKNCNFTRNSISKYLIALKNSFFQISGAIFLDNYLHNLSKEGIAIIIQSQSSNISAAGITLETSSLGSFLIFLQAQKGVFSLKKLQIKGSNSEDRALVYFEASTVEILSANFSLNTGRCLEIVNSNFLLQDTSFVENNPNREDLPSDIVYRNKIKANMNGKILGVFVKKTTASGLSCMFSNLETLEITQGKFLGSEDTSIKGRSVRAIVLISVFNFTLKNGYFFNLNSESGPGAALQSSAQSEYMSNLILIQSSIFKNCSSHFGGAAFHFSNSRTISVFHCSFESNIALVSERNKDPYSGMGACGIVTCTERICRMKLVNNSFLNNFAQFHSPLIVSNISMLDESSFLSENNDAEGFTDGFTIYPIDIKIVTNAAFLTDPNNLAYEINKKVSLSVFDSGSDLFTFRVSSGETINITFCLTDQLNQEMIFEKNSRAIFEIADDRKGITLSNSIGTNEKGSINFRNLKIQAPPGSTVKLTLTFSIPPFSGLNSDAIVIKKPLFVKVAACKMGEIVLVDLTCYKCQRGFYSLIDPMIVSPSSQRCELCLAEAVCPGGSMIFPAPGFWRPHNKTLKILECPIKESCAGPFQGNMNESQKLIGGCLKGHSNNLCFECDLGYGRMSSAGVCLYCEEEKVGYLLRFILGILFILIYTVGGSYAYSHQSGNENQFGYIFVFIKITVSFAQVITLLKFLKLYWALPNFENVFSSGSQTVSFGLDEILFNDCLLERKNSSGQKDSISQFNTKIGIVVLLPVVLFFLSSLLWALHFFLRRSREKNSPKAYLRMEKLFRVRIFACFIISIFLFQPVIIKNSFNLINCVNINPDQPGQSFLKVFPILECWSDSHIYLILLAFIPSLVVWGLGFPIFLMIILMKQQKFKETRKSPKSPKKTRDQIYLNEISEESPEFKSGHIDQQIRFKNSTFSLSLPKQDPFFKKQTSESVQQTNQAKPRSGVFTSLYKSNVFRFLYFGYSDRFSYWECLIFLKKFFISMLVNTHSFLGSELVSLLLLLLLFFAMFLHFKFTPYSDSELNFHEMLCQLSSIVIFAGIILLSSQEAGLFIRGLASFLLIFFFLLVLLSALFFITKTLQKNNLIINFWMKIKGTNTKTSQKNKLTIKPSDNRIKLESIK